MKVGARKKKLGAKLPNILNPLNNDKKIFYSNIIKYLQHKSLKNKWLQNKFKSSNQVYILPLGSQSQHSYQESKAFVREK